MTRKLDISASDRLRIREAIASAEATTSGEIFTVVARVSDEYRIIPVLWATLVALLVPLPLLFFGIPSDWLRPLAGGWTGSPGAPFVELPAVWIYVAQLIVFILLAILLSLPGIRPLVVPRGIREARAQGLAAQQFLAHGLHMTDARTGVLIFVSLAEHYAEIIADAAIADKIGESIWDEIMADLIAAIRGGRLADGLVAAIDRTGAVLAGHFPPRPHDANELKDDLVLL